MLIDQLNIFFDTVDAAASGTSKSIPLAPYMGRGNPVNVSVFLKGASAPVTLGIILQESEDNTTFTDVATYSMSKPDAKEASFGFALPQSLKGKYMRLSYSLTGTATGLKLFAGVTRDHFAPYSEGQYIDKGKVRA